MSLTHERVRAAGFKHIIRFDAVDGKNPVQRYRAWQAFPKNFLRHSDPEFRWHPATQGCYLSHMAVWKKISYDGIPAAVVFEDDVLFHENWHELWPTYWQQTPKDFDVTYMGSHVEFAPAAVVDVQPVLCNHAMIITCSGATKLYDYTVSQQARAIDWISYWWQQKIVEESNFDLFRWYVWTARTKMSLFKTDPLRHVGLVFQDRTLLSDIRGYS